MPKYYRVNLKDKENNIIYPNIHNEIQIEQNGTMKLKTLIPLYDNSYTLGNSTKNWNNIFSYSLALDNQSGSWLNARDNNYGIYFKNQLTTTAYYQFFKMKTLNGHTITIGGIRDRFYIGSMKADRTENETDNFFSFDANLGVFIFGGDVALRTGFYLPTYKGDNSWHLTQNNDKDFIGSYKTTGEYGWKFKITPVGNLVLQGSTNTTNLYASGTASTIGGKRILLSESDGNYWGMLNPGGSHDWIRTTSLGIIPYDSTGNSSCLGTKSWLFKSVHAKAFLGGGLGEDASCKLYPGHSNEINFGGTGTQSTMHFGYRSMDGRSVITAYCFRGGNNAYADITAKGVYASGGLLYSTNNSNTVTIGSQNSSYCHIYNSANIPFYFNRAVYVNAGWRAVGSANSSALNLYVLGLSTWNSNYGTYANGTIGFCY